MGSFKMWLTNFMRGRYGNDDLNKFLIIVTLVLIILDIFVRWRWIDILTVLLLIYIYSRMFSRSINNRYAENQKFLAFASKFRRGKGAGYGNAGGGFTGFGGGDKDHKVMRCPGCGQRLRVPKGAGTIMIKCPNCNTQFQKKV